MLRSWGDETPHFDWRADPKPLRVFPRRFSWASFCFGAAIAVAVVAAVQWITTGDGQWGVAAIGAALATPMCWLLAEVD